MILRDILKGYNYEILKGSDDININKLQYDSRKIQKGDLFFAIKGYKYDGTKYIESAKANGASSVICEDKNINIDGINVIFVDDVRCALSIAASNYYNNPTKSLKLIGVTGTNGKTTHTYMIKSILEHAGYKTGLIGTIENYIGEKRIKTERTTPEALELNELFSEMVSSGIEYCIMEVSSHSLYLHRVYGIEFDFGIFTNLTRDHLDFHGDFENYYLAKKILFKNSKISIINIDDPYGIRLYEEIQGEKYSYSIEAQSDYRASSIEYHGRGSSFTVKGKDIYEVNLNIPGDYNIYNALAAIAPCDIIGISKKHICEGLENAYIKGRCEIVTKDYDLGFDVIVDYSHTPDALMNILKNVKKFTPRKLICVVGCGGDRDKTKRPIMGEIGKKYSDILVITSDNPRTEDPFLIIEDIKKGIDNYNNVYFEENRREAICLSMKLAHKGDIIVIAGKGHEDYQVLKDKTIDFDERIVVKELIEENFSNVN